MKYVYMVNRFNLKETSGTVIRKLRDASRELNREYEILVNETPEDAKEAVWNLRGKECIITALGGDGTINLLLNDLAGTGNILSYLPVGTGNDFHRTCMETFDDGIHETDIVRINDRYFINAACFGIDADIANDDAFIHNHMLPKSMRYNAGVLYHFLTYNKGRKLKIECNDETIENPIKAFVIRAGYIGSDSLFQTNYYAYLTDDKTLQNFDVNAWHRLTVRTIANIGGNNVGFIVYLDQKPLAYDEDCGDNFSPSTDAQNYYNDEIHAVYPSAVDANITGGDQIAAVAFSGNGAIDDVVFTTTKPKFIENSESVVVPFVADAGVTAISVLPDGATDAILVDMTADTLVAVLPAQTTAFTVTATIDTANGYTLGGISYGGTPVVDGEVTGYAGGDITITTVRNNFNLFDANDDPISGTFQTLTEAFAAEGVAMIKLAYDYDALAFEGDDFAGYDIDSEIILDLNGNDLDGGDDSAGASLFRVADTLTIKDSVGGGSITYDTQYGYAIVKNDGSDVFIGAATGDAGATFNGKLFEDGYEGNIVKGYIDDANNADEGEFLWGTYVVGDSDYELAGDYWVVAPKGGSTTFALTTTGGANAEITTDPTDVSALTEETEVTITATATNGFTYATVDLAGDWTYDSQTDAISMTTNISENTTVVVPDAVSEQSQEDWPEGEALIDAEGKAAGDLFPGITNALATADAKAVATWAEANNIAYADKGSILPEAFLLNCANTQAAIDEAAANFKITAITVAGDTVTIAPADGVDYGNGKVVIEGTATLSPISWHEKTTGDHFFRATLVVKPVAAP